MGSTTPTLLGRLLVNYGMISPQELEDALRAQESSHEPLGQILVTREVLSQRGLELALRAQARLRGRPDRAKPHVLVIDDDPEIGAVVGEILAGAGYSVGVAQNEQEARAAMTAEDSCTPSLIVLDLAMPETHGLDLLCELRRLTYHTIPVVVLTGHGDAAAEQRAQELGIRAYLTKPAPARTLVEVVDSVLSGAAAPS